MQTRGFRLFSALLLAALSASGQGATSRLIGTVQDPSGAGVAGADVKLISEGTNAVFSARAAENGAFFFDAVQAGLYTVAVEARGFKKFASRGNRVTIGQPATVNVTLELGTLTEVVTVDAQAEAVQTSTSGNIGNLFNENLIKDLPIVGTRGRNPLDLVTRQPGVVSGANTGGGTHVNGARDRAWNFTLDGIDANETSAGGSNFAPIRTNPDMLQEFRVLTGNATAEFGRNSGGQVAMITRSGSNEIHASAFWFYRTPRLNANEWENNLNRVGKRQFVQNIPGGSIGGPVLRNRLFYYGNVQLLRARESALTSRLVYTQQARDGIWRFVRGGRNQPAGVPGASIDAGGNVLSGLNIGTYSIVANDPDRLGLNSRVRALIQSTPLPNNFTSGDGLNTAGFNFTALQIEKQHDVTAKADYVLNEKNTIFARISFGRQDTTCDRANGGSPFFPGGECVVNTKRDPKNYAFNWRIAPRPALTNELVVGLNQFAFDFNTPTADLNGISLVSTPVLVPETFEIGNARRLKTWQVVDNFSWFRGPHSIKFGTNLRLASHRDIRGSIGGFNSSQRVDFSRAVNTVDAARFGLPADINQQFDRASLESSINFLLGRVGATNRGFVASGDAFTAGVYNFIANFNEYDYYIQDTWKIARNLTIDLGVRLEMKMAPSNPEDRIRRPDQLAVAGAAPSNTLKWVSDALYNSDKNNFGPSIGFAWDPFSTGKTSVRGNYRIAYDRINTFLFSSAVFQNLPGIVIGQQDVAFGQSGGRLQNLPVLQPPAGNPNALSQPAAFGTGNITVADPNFETPTTHQWSFNVQREILKHTVFELSYIGRRAHNLYGAYNANQARIRPNGFLDAARAAAGGADNPLINQLMSVDTRKTAAETGSQAFRRIYTTELRNNSVGTIAQDLSRRTVGGRGQAEAAGLGPYFFVAYPQFASALNVVDSNDWSTYNALQMQIERRLSSGLTWQFSYTFAKSLDTRSFDPAFTTVATANSQSAGSTPYDIENRRLNYGLSDFDRRHVAQSYWLYELPFGRGRKFLSGVNDLAGRIVGGWQIAGFGTFQSGRPFSAYSGNYTFNNVVQSFANCAGCDAEMGRAADGPGDVIWFFTQEQIARFSQPAMGELGNTGRNAFRSPGGFQVDASILKRTALTERLNLELRADMLNLTNSPFFGAPTATLTSATYGRIRDTVLSSSRKIQIGAKINF